MEIQIIDEEGERKYPARKRNAVAPPPGTASPGARYQNEALTSPNKFAKLDAPPKSKKSRSSQKVSPRPSLSNVKKLVKQTEDQNKNVTHSSPQGLSPFAKLWRCQLTLKNTFPCETCGRLLASPEALQLHEAMHENTDTSENKPVPATSSIKIASLSPVVVLSGPLHLSKLPNPSTTPNPSKLSNTFTPNSSKVGMLRNSSPSKTANVAETPDSTNSSSSKTIKVSHSSASSSPTKAKPENASREGTTFYCDICCLYFSSKRSLERHFNREIHLQKLRSPAKAPELLKAVPANGLLEESVSSEGTENSYSTENSNSMFCEVCQQTFSSKSSLKRHLRTVGHKARENSTHATPTPPTTPKSTPLNVSLPPGNSCDSPLTCSVCHKTYSTKSNHKRHYLTHFK